MNVDTPQVIAHLREKWRDKNCPMCGGGPWEVQPTLFQITAWTPGYLQPGLPTIPLCPITCKNCGNTILINAIISQTVPAQPPEDVSNEQSNKDGGKNG